MMHANYFGTVDNNQIIIRSKMGLQTIPIDNIEYITIKHNRNMPMVIVYFLLCLIVIPFAFKSSIIIDGDIEYLPTVVNISAIVISAISALVGYSYYKGYHTIDIKTSNTFKSIHVAGSKTEEGIEFYNGIKSQLG